MAAEGLRKLTEYGDSIGINTIVENHGGLSSNGKWLAGVIEKVDHPRCGTLPDFGNFRIGTTAEGQDQWWQPVVDTGLTEDRWVTGIEIQPSLEGRRVTYHSNVYLQQEEEPGDHTPAIDVTPRGSYLSEFAIGKIGDVFRENTGKLIKAGAQFTFDNHYHSVGEDVTATTDVGIWFYPKGFVPKYRVYGQAMGAQQSQATMDIPPGKVTVHHAYIPLDAPARLENYQPHMHIRGKAMSMEAIYPDGRVEMLNHVADFDFNWHVNYVYTDDSAPVLPRGTVIHLTAWHDNTAANRANPDYRQWIGWGQRSFCLLYTSPSQRDATLSSVTSSA